MAPKLHPDPLANHRDLIDRAERARSEFHELMATHRSAFRFMLASQTAWAQRLDDQPPPLMSPLAHRSGI
jgi:hypothetical protein